MARTEVIRVECAGTPITAALRHEAADLVLRAAGNAIDSGVDVHLCNAYTISLAHRHPSLKQSLNAAGFNFPDGMSVVWACRILSTEVLPTNRVYGPDLFVDVLDKSQGSEVRHYLLGGAPDVLKRLESEIKRRFPAAVVVGAESPPFRALTSDEYVDQLARLKSSGANIVWLGLGTPKQDYEAARLARDVPAVFVAVGAAFDFLAGSKRQAPSWMQNSGLEWLFRLCQEPRRLWRRYLVGNLVFVWAVWRGRFRQRRMPREGRDT